MKCKVYISILSISIYIHISIWFLQVTEKHRGISPTSLGMLAMWNLPIFFTQKEFPKFRPGAKYVICSGWL